MANKIKIETEIKLPVRDVKNLVATLNRLGVRSRGRVFEQNVLYDTPESDLRRSGWLLRLRKETPARSKWPEPGHWPGVMTAKMPSKSKSSRYKKRFEREKAVCEPGRCAGVLSSNGFRPGFRYEKFRTSFRVGALKVDLDETPLGAFLELEGSGKAIDEIARVLGYSIHDYVRATYWELYASDCRRRGVPTKNLVFDKEKSPKLSTLRLTKIRDTFSSQIEGQKPFACAQFRFMQNRKIRPPR